DSIELLPLKHLVGHIADENDQRATVRGAVDRERDSFDGVVRFLANVQRAASGLPRTECRMERAEVGPENLRRAEGAVKVFAERRGVAVRQLDERVVAPENLLLRVEKHHALR